MPYCKKCGSIATDENAQFCARCGSALERENDSFEGKRRPLHDVGERGQEDDAFEGSRRPLHDVAQPESENLPEKRYRPYQRVIAGIGVGCLVIIAGLALLLIVASICAPSDTNDQLPVYTPTPADIDAAYAKGIADIEESLESLDGIYTTAIRDLNAVPKAMDGALREALSCKVHIDALTNDPREASYAKWAWNSPGFSEVKYAPNNVTWELAAARVSSPADRDLLGAAFSDAFPLGVNARNANPEDPKLDPVLRTYVDYYRKGSAINAFRDALKELDDAYYSVVEDIHKPALNYFIRALEEASTTRDCQGLLLLAHEEYMHTYEVHHQAFVAYFADLKSALEAYVTALDDERRHYASNR